MPGQVSAVLAASTKVITEQCPELPSPAHNDKPPVVLNTQIGTTLQDEFVLLNYLLKR